MTFQDILNQLRDGKGYRFGTWGLDGYFYKAPFPSEDHHTERDGAHSAITFWGTDRRRASPTLMLYDFDEAGWWITRYDSPIT